MLETDKVKVRLGFPCASAGKKSASNAGDLASISGLGRSAGERNSYPLQYSGLENSIDCIVHGVAKSWTWQKLNWTDFYLWASLVAQMVKNLPAMQQTWVWSLSWEDPLEKGKATYSSILAWRIPWTEEPGRLQSMRSQGVRHDWGTNTLNIMILLPFSSLFWIYFG